MQKPTWVSNAAGNIATRSVTSLYGVYNIQVPGVSPNRFLKLFTFPSFFLLPFAVLGFPLPFSFYFFLRLCPVSPSPFAFRFPASPRRWFCPMSRCYTPPALLASLQICVFRLCAVFCPAFCFAFLLLFFHLLRVFLPCFSISI